MTQHEVRATQAGVTDGRYWIDCACSCGWHGASQAAREPQALAEAGRVRVEHLLEAHPRQTPSSWLRPRAAARYRHPRSSSAATRRERRWVRHAACACGWTSTVRGPSAGATARAARREHLAHVTLHTGRTPSRDYAVMTCLLLVGVLVIGLAAVAVEVSGGDPQDLRNLGALLLG